MSQEGLRLAGYPLRTRKQFRKANGRVTWFLMSTADTVIERGDGCRTKTEAIVKAEAARLRYVERQKQGRETIQEVLV